MLGQTFSSWRTSIRGDQLPSVALFLHNGVNQEHFIPQMHHLLSKTPPIMWLLKKQAEIITDSKGCILFTLWSLSSSHSSFFVFLSLYLICSSPTCLPHFLVPLQPLPLQVLSLIHHSLAFSFFPRVYFQEMGSKCKMDWDTGLGIGCLVFLICFISVQFWEKGWGNTKTMRIQ